MFRRLVLAATLALCGIVAPASGQDIGDVPSVSLQQMWWTIDFKRPIQLLQAPGETGRFFVVQQRGLIRVLEGSDAKSATTFLDATEAVRMRHNEEGLLGMVFHPKYVENRQFYIIYSSSEPRRNVLARFTASESDPNVADPESFTVVMEVEQPFGNHNGATMLFGPDGYLYVSLGDGGFANDPKGHGQKLSTLLGTIIRIDVDTTEGERQYGIPSDNPFVGRKDARDEIWAYGLRNVWRMSFDRETGDLWAGDVGQNKWEEIDLIVKGGNYGWNIREGKHEFAGGTSEVDLIEPVIDYERSLGQSVTGGHVYRGEAISALEGHYVYGDYVSGRIWALRYENGVVVANGEILTRRSRKFVASFGEDAAGELYICTFTRVDGQEGRIYKIVPR